MAEEEKYDYQIVLETIVKALVDHPEEVQVQRKLDEMGVLLTLKVHKDDMGAVVGRQGATARAIRTLVRIIGMKNQARVNLKIEEPEGGRGPRSARASEEGGGEERAPSADSLDNLQL